MTEELRINKPFKFKPFGPVELKVLDIDKTDNKCLFELRDPSEGKILTSWIKAGDPISFGSAEVSRLSPRLLEIGEDTVLVKFYWADEVVEYHWRWQFWE